MRIFLILLLAASTSNLCAQVTNEMEDESKLYAQTKQVNQFFRRFNGEEDEKGERYYPRDKQYHSVKLRKKFLPLLFDASGSVSSDLASKFTKDVLEREKPSLLDFHGGNWFSEVQATFTINNQQIPVTLFMELEKHRQGTRWIIAKAYAQYFADVYKRDTLKVGQFLHPLSHELGFMNMRKAFVNPDSLGHYVSKKFRPDHLTMIFYEMRRGNMKFVSVTDMKFHFFQIDGWYFEVSEFNRPGYNTGWLISNLVKLEGEKERELLKKHLYYE